MMERDRAILDKTRFIEGLNLPTRYSDGVFAQPYKGLPVKGIDVTERQYLLVEDVKRATIDAKIDWPILPSNSIDNGLASESEIWSDEELLELFHKGNKTGSRGIIKKSQRDLAKEYNISQSRISELLNKAEKLIAKANPKPINSVFELKRETVKDERRSKTTL